MKPFLWGLGVLLMAPVVGAQPNSVQLDELEARVSCRRGEAVGCFNEGVDLYRRGQKKMAIPYFQRACYGGIGEGCFRVAKALSSVERYAWLVLGEERGYGPARMEKDRLLKQLSSKQVDEGGKRAKVLRLRQLKPQAPRKK